MSPFHRILVNNLLANITNFTAWFAITFWVFLETGSVFATGMIAGIFLTFTGVLGIWLGALVDHHGKTEVMAGSSLASFAFYALSFALMQAAPAGAFANPYGAWLWILVVLVMGGVIAGNIRSIALPRQAIKGIQRDPINCLALLAPRPLRPSTFDSLSIELHFHVIASSIRMTLYPIFIVFQHFKTPNHAASHQLHADAQLGGAILAQADVCQNKLNTHVIRTKVSQSLKYTEKYNFAIYNNPARERIWRCRERIPRVRTRSFFIART